MQVELARFWAVYMCMCKCKHDARRTGRSLSFEFELEQQQHEHFPPRTLRTTIREPRFGGSITQAPRGHNHKQRTYAPKRHLAVESCTK